jgi:catechol-2,3-dioxygenase
MARVTGLHRLGLLVHDLGKVGEFYHEHWGMKRDGSDGREMFFRSQGTDHSDVMLRKGEDPRLDHVALSVASEADLRAILENIERAAHPVAQPPRKGTRPDEALVAAVNDLDGNRIELIVSSSSVKPKEAADPAKGPKRLGHVVLWTPQPERQEAFYALLGFQVSDRTHVGMSFLRCNTDHHTIAFVRSSSGRSGLQHAAFDVGSLDAVMRGFGRLRDAGIACIWGVGRHGPGNNIFSYYTDPVNNIVEYYGDMEQVPVTETVDVRHWGPEHKGDVWGVAGPPPPAFRN